MKIVRYQEGGVAPEMAPQAAPAQAGPEEQIMQMANEIINQLGPDGAAMLAEAIMQLLQQGGTPEAGAAPAEQQFMRKGGKICKKAQCGTKTKKAVGGCKVKRSCK